MVHLDDFIRYYPVLRYTPEDIQQNLDLSELYIPNPYEIVLIRELAERLQKFIILYKSKYTVKATSLQKKLVPAELYYEDRLIVNQYKEKLGNLCRLIVYEPKLECTTPKLEQARRSRV